VDCRGMQCRSQLLLYFARKRTLKSVTGSMDRMAGQLPEVQNPIAAGGG
jgi:hypothetical protein